MGLLRPADAKETWSFFGVPSTKLSCALLTAVTMRCFLPDACAAGTSTDDTPIDHPATSPSGLFMLSFDKSNLVVIRSGGEAFRQELTSSLAESFRAYWTKDDRLLAVSTSPLPRAYDFLVIDTISGAVVYNAHLDAESVTNSAVAFFKYHAASFFKDNSQFTVVQWPTGWKDTQTLKVNFVLYSLSEHTNNVSDEVYTVCADARFTAGGWKFGQFYDLQKSRL